jgi:hypothetical protein
MANQVDPQIKQSAPKTRLEVLEGIIWHPIARGTLDIEMRQ